LPRHVAELVLGFGFGLSTSLVWKKKKKRKRTRNDQRKTSVDKNPKFMFKRDIGDDQGFPVLTILLHHCMTERGPGW